MNSRRRAQQDEIPLERLDNEVGVRWPDQLPRHPRPILGGDVPLTNLCAGILAEQLSGCGADAVAFRDVELAALAHALASFLGIDRTVFVPPPESHSGETPTRTSARPKESNLLFLHGIIEDDNRVATDESLSGDAGKIVARASLIANPEVARRFHIHYVKPIPG
ncbi:MAG: hypothetical protein R6U92_01030 [Bacillota bacterium]